MILMEKDVDEVVFFSLFPEENDIIKNIMKLVIENHFPNEGYVEDDTVSHAEHDAVKSPYWLQTPMKRPGRVTSTRETTKT